MADESDGESFWSLTVILSSTGEHLGELKAKPSDTISSLCRNVSWAASNLPNTESKTTEGNRKWATLYHRERPLIDSYTLQQAGLRNGSTVSAVIVSWMAVENAGEDPLVVRACPSADSDVIGYLRPGVPVALFCKQSGWGQVVALMDPQISFLVLPPFRGYRGAFWVQLHSDGCDAHLVPVGSEAAAQAERRRQSSSAQHRRDHDLTRGMMLAKADCLGCSSCNNNSGVLSRGTSGNTLACRACSTPYDLLRYLLGLA